MNLEQLRRRFRVLAKDTVEPFLYADDDIADWLTDAEAQACMRGRLLLDDYTPSVCVVPVVAGTHGYNLHPKLYELVLVRFKATGDTRSDPVRLVSREWMDDNVRDWRDADNWSYTSASRRYAVQSETGLRIVPAPDVAGELLIEGYRLPMRPLANDNDKPEIHEASHEKLIQWALFRAFSVPDSESFDPQRSENAQAEFTRHFGLPVDADLRRSTRTDQVQHNTAYPP